ncbi:MAG: electron transfer flavoprotein subunit alpha/FixB family protein [Actinomycetota bacterium]|nr:electron transfer flavoprotein subunit alpha/FixB family protein [Actinomycetota bacterium]
MTVLVLCDHDRGALSEASLEAMTFGRVLAGQTNVPCTAVLIGAGANDAIGGLAAYGAEAVHIADHELLTDYGPEAWGETLTQLVQFTNATAVTACGTDRGNEVLAQVAARLGEPFVANCRQAEPDNSVWSATRVQWGGSLLEDVTVEAGVHLLSVAPHTVEVTPAEAAGAGTIAFFNPDLDASLARSIVNDRVVRTRGITLTTAPVVVGGGRGVGSAEGFAPLEELAATLGGVVGCSRAVTNNGWRPHSDQVGQTGTRIAPDLYIANGISGAIQHWVGAMASKNILAINTDPEANMVVKAGYAVIGDLHQVVPAIIEELKKRCS